VDKRFREEAVRRALWIRGSERRQYEALWIRGSERRQYEEHCG